MSRIGKQPVVIPAGVTVEVRGQTVNVKGPRGELSLEVHGAISVKLDKEKNRLVFARRNEETSTRALHGTMRALANNMVIGVTEGYTKQLEVVGVGYQARMQGHDLALIVGYSHPVVLSPPEKVAVELPSATQIVITGPDKRAVGEFAAEVRRVRPPEPYKGKGIKYRDEVIRRKAGKAFVTTE
ncbi:MAG TPA: 50S ribosomal protein L6 [Planctomycetota bacterium]|nr:50S ribosomal protein L6 [Planctomycetota bacterium]